MSNLPQNGAELKALLEAEQTPTRESKVIIGTKTKAEMLSDQTNKQQTISTKTQDKVSELKINRADVDTTKVSFGEYLENTPDSLSFDDALEAYNNKQIYDRNIEDQLRNQLYETNRSRTAGEIVSDTALSTGKIGVTMGQMGLGIADLAGRVVGVDNLGDTVNTGLGTAVNKITFGQLAEGKKLIPSDAIEQIDKKMSTKMQAQQQNVKDRVAAVAEQNKKDIAALGENASWWDKFNAQGKEYDELLSALVDNPTALSDVALSSALAFTVPAVVGKAAKHYAKKQGVEDLAKLDSIGEWGAVAGTAGLEGFSQAYEEKQKVLDMPVEQLAKTSPKFLEYADKYGVEKAKQMIADAVYTSNLGLMAVASAVASKRTGAAVLEKDLFVGSNVAEAIGKEVIEETAQSGSGMLIQNWTEQRLVDENQEIQEGFGQSVATGLAGAATSTAAMSGTANALEFAATKASEKAQKIVQKAHTIAGVNAAINKALASNDFSEVENIGSTSRGHGSTVANMLLSEEVLAKTTPEQKLIIADVARRLFAVGSEKAENTTEEKPLSKKEEKQSELLESVAENFAVNAHKAVVEPVLQKTEEFTEDDNKIVLRTLGSSPDSFEDEDLINLTEKVSDDIKPVVEAVLEARTSLNAIAEAKESKSYIQVNDDVINGTKEFAGLNTFKKRFEAAISNNGLEKAKHQITKLGELATLQAQKLADIEHIFNLAQQGAGSLVLNELNKQYREKYKLKEFNSIHLGSKNYIETIKMEVSALQSNHKAMSAVYQVASGEKVDTLPSVSTTFVTPSVTAKATPKSKPVAQQPVSTESKPVKTVSTKSVDGNEELLSEKVRIEKAIAAQKQSIAVLQNTLSKKKGYSASTQKEAIKASEDNIARLQTRLDEINSKLNTSNVSDQLTEDTAQASVPPEQTQPTAAPESKEDRVNRLLSERENHINKIKQFTKVGLKIKADAESRGGATVKQMDAVAVLRKSIADRKKEIAKINAQLEAEGVTNTLEEDVTNTLESAPVEEAKPVASSEAATATEAVADETTELSIKEKAKKYIQDSLEEYKAKGRNSDTLIHLVYDKEGNLLKTYNKDLSDVAYLVFQRVDPRTKQPFKKRYLVRVEDNQIIAVFKEPKIPLNKEEIKNYINESIAKSEPVQEDVSASKTPIFDSLPSYKQGQRTMRYAGVGSRETPQEILDRMSEIAELLAQKGYTLQSGGAKGADKAFEKGAGKKKKIFFAKNATAKTRAIAKEIHPNPASLDKGNGYILDLMARNTNQVFGADLYSPVDFVLVWTPDGAESTAERSIKTGGTGQAIDMASRKGIPVINMANADWELRLQEVLDGTYDKSNKLTAKRIFELVTEGILVPVNKILKSLFTKQEVDTVNINKAIKQYSEKLGKSLNRLGETRIKERIAAFTQGVEDAINYSIDSENKDNDYREGVSVALENIKYNTAKASIINRKYNNVIGSFLKSKNKDNLFNKTPLFKLAVASRKILTDLSPESRAVMNSFIKFSSGFSKTFGEIINVPEKLDSVERKHDYISLFADEHGHFDNNFVTALSAVAYTWLTQSASGLIHLDEKQVNKLLGFHESNELDSMTLAALSKVGLTRDSIAEQLGKEVINLMGFEFDKDLDENKQQTMIMSLGTAIIAIMQDKGYVETKAYGYFDFIAIGLDPNTTFTRLGFNSKLSTAPNASKMFKLGMQDGYDKTIDKNNKNPDYIAGTDAFRSKTIYLRPVTKKQVSTKRNESDETFTYDGMQDDIHEAMNLLRDERIVENKSVLNTVFDIEDTNEDPVFVKPEKVSRKVRKQRNMFLSEKQEKAMEIMSQRPWEMSSVANVFMSLPDAIQKSLAGYKTAQEIEELHISERAAETIKSDGVVRTISNFMDFFKAAEDREFYLPTYGVKNTRMFYRTNTINPQSNKLIRRLVSMKDNKVTIDLSNPEHEQNWRIALMDAFNIKPEFKQIVTLHDIGTDKLTAFLQKPEIELVVNSILEGDLGTNEKALNALMDLQNETQTGFHMVQGLIALAQAKQANGKPFETDLIMEVDGVANGVAILMWQFAGADESEFRHAMNRAGVYQEGEETSFTEYAGNNNQDSYQKLTEVWDKALNELETFVMTSSMNDINTLMRFKLDENNKLVPEWQDEKNLKFAINYLQGTYKTKEEIYNKIQALRELLTPMVLDGSITKFGRDLSKKPTMTFIYNAGHESIMAGISAFTIDNLYATLKKTKLRDKDGNIIPENQAKLARLTEVVRFLIPNIEIDFANDTNVVYPQGNFKGEGVRVSNLNWLLDEAGVDARTTYDALLKNTYGVALQAAMQQVYGRLLNGRNTANSVIRYAFIVFNTLYEQRKKQFLQQTGKSSLSATDKEQLLDGMKDLWPILHTRSSKNPEEAILLFKEKARKVYKKAGEKIGSFGVLQEYRRPLNNGNAIGSKSASVNGRQMVLEEPGAGGIPVATQSIDAHTMMDFQMQYGALNVHDAIGINPAVASLLAEVMNRSFRDVAMSDYNIEGELSLLMEKFLNIAEDYNISEQVMKDFNSKFDRDLGISIENRYVEYNTAQELLDTIKANFEESEKIRKSFKPYAYSQYDHISGAYVPTESTVSTISDNDVKDIIEQILKDSEYDNPVILGSTPKGKSKAKENYKNARIEQLTADNTVAVFDTLNTLGLVRDNDNHVNNLRDVLGQIVSKVIKPTTFVLGEVNSKTRGKFIQTLRGSKIKQAIGNTLHGLSAQETYVHELVHAVTVNALSSGTIPLKRIKAMFDAVKTLVDEGKITYEDFLPLDANGETITNPTAEQIADAKERLDYVFNNSDVEVVTVRDPDTGFLNTIRYNNSHAEFIAFGVTNEAFKKMLNKPDVLMALKQHLKPERTKTTSNSKVIRYFDSAVNYLLDLVQRVLDALSDKIFGLNGKPMDEQLVVLVSQLAGATGNHQSKLLRVLDSITEHRTAATMQLKQWVSVPLIKFFQSKMVRNSKFRVVRTTGRLIGAINNSKAGSFVNALKQVRSRIKVSEDNFAQALASEMVGRTKGNRKWHVMLAIANKNIDQLRKHTQTIVKNVLNEQFATPLSSEERIAMTYVLMRTDISKVLGLGYTHENIQDFLRDEVKLSREIDTLIAAFNKKYPKGESNWMLAHADNLSTLMITGESKLPNTLLNTYNIARRWGRDEPAAVIDEVAAENELEVLISLMALKKTPAVHKNNVLRVLGRELINGKNSKDNGITFTLEFHKNYVEESLGENFNGDKTQTRKGYIKEQYDPNIGIRLGDDLPDTVKAFAALGYEKTEMKLTMDAAQNRTETFWVYRNTSAKLATNSAGIVSYTGTVNKGYSIQDQTILLANGHTNIGLETFLENRDIAKRLTKNSNKLMQSNTVEESTLIPVFDNNGKIKTYRYEMSLQNKRKYMNSNEAFDDLLSNMQAHIKDKSNSKQMNDLVVQTLKEEFDDEYIKSPKEFTYVGPDSNDPKMKELWYMLPDSMKIEFNKQFKPKKGFYVKTRNLRLIFGFRKFTVGELFKRKDAVGNVSKVLLNMAGNHINTLLNKPIVHNTEEIWQEIVRMAKDTIVIKTGATLVTNVLSNVAVLATEGVSFSDMVKYGAIAWKGASKYQKDKAKLDRLKLDFANRTDLTQVEMAKLKREIALLENEISTNPVYELIQAGVYQTIVEDVDMEDNPFSFKSKLEQKVEPVLDWIPDLIKDTGKILLMTHDTQLYKAMRNSTQLSDFVGRFILHEHNKNKLKMSKQDSVDNIVETFVNYDLPTHRSIQYLNDMGFIMFSKFFLRIQKVIVRQLSTRLVNVIGLLTIQQVLGIDFADIYDSNLLATDSVESKFSFIDEHIGTLIEPHLINNI